MKNILLLIASAAIITGCGERNQTTPNTKKDHIASEVYASEPAPTEHYASEAIASGPSPYDWSYSTDKDKMRGSEIRLASVSAAISDETIRSGATPDFENLYIRKAERSGEEVYIASDDIIECGYNGCYVLVKFDDLPAEKLRATRATNSKGIFFQSKGLIKKIKAHKTMMVEIELYSKPSKQVSFNIANLKWD